MVFGCPADQARSADIDVLDRRRIGHVRFGYSFFEGIKIHDHQLERNDAVSLKRLHVVWPIVTAENAAVNFRM